MQIWAALPADRSRAIDQQGGFAAEFHFFQDSSENFASIGSREASAADMVSCWKNSRFWSRNDFVPSGSSRCKFHEPFQERFRPGRATGNVNVHRDELIDPLQDGVAAIHAAARSAGAHGDAPFRFGHLVPNPFDGQGHLVGDGAGDDHDVALARRKAHHFRAEAGDIETAEAVAISSMAQQARPMGMGQSEFLRIQFMAASSG